METKGDGKGEGKGAPPPPKGKGKGAPPAPPGGKGPGKGGPPLVKAPGGFAPPISKAAAPVYSGPKLRPVFWTTVNDVPQDSIWVDLQPVAPYDLSTLERQFAATASRPMKEKRTDDNKEGERKRLRVLDDRTSQNLNIALARLPEPARLAQMVDKFDDFPWKVPTEAVHMIANAINENREAIEQLRTVGSEDAIARLDVPERFLWEMDKVPHIIKKLRVGQLIVSSTELGEWRNKLAKVGIACQMVRKSKHLSRCISTALSIGNHLNRGTARADAQGLVVPDSLLKLDEVRAANGGADDPQAEGQKGPSLLDFLATALVDAEVINGESNGQLSNAIQVLQNHLRAASGVALEEIMAAVPLKINEAQSVAQGMGDLEPTPGQQRAAKQVQSILDEANLALKLGEGAKSELERLQRWSCAKMPQKSEAWFGLWHQFFEKLLRAINRAYTEKAQQQKANAEGAVHETARPVLMEICSNSNQRPGASKIYH